MINCKINPLCPRLFLSNLKNFDLEFFKSGFIVYLLFNNELTILLQYGIWRRDGNPDYQ